MNRTLLSLAFVVLSLVAKAGAQDKLNVVATLPDLAAIAMQVGGPFINLSTLANPAEDPHFVDPKPSFAKTLNKADLLIDGGADLESGWLPPLVQNARNPKILPGQPGRFSGSQGIVLKEKPSTADRSQGDVHMAGNPHYLMDPANAGILAAKLAERLAQLDPDDGTIYKQNASKFADEIDARNNVWEKMMVPFKGTKVITYHRTFNYFLDHFGLELFDTIEPKPGIEPSATHIASLIARAKTAGVKFILIEENRPRKTPEKIAQEIGAKVVVLRHMPESTGQIRYTAWIRGMVESLGKAASSQ